MTATASPPAPRRRSRVRTVAFVLVGIALFGVLVEATAWVAYGLVHGKAYSGEAVRAERARLAETAPDAAATSSERSPDQVATDVLRREMNKVVHPYLGFVMNPEDNSATRAAANHWRTPISDRGYFDVLDPLEPADENTLRIGVFGGSVASILAYTAGDVLVDELRSMPGLAHRRIDVVNLALPALKQPQQLLTLDYLLAQGAPLDVVVNLDGVNDICMPILAHERGIHPGHPDGWNLLMSNVPSVARQKLVGEAVFLRSARRGVARWFEDSWVGGWSVTANVVWSSIDHVLEGRVQRANAAVQDFEGDAPSYAVTGPAFAAEGETDVRDYAQDLWQRCSRLMHERCVARGIHYLHLLQPNQYAPDSGKSLTAEERKSAYDENHVVCRLVRAGYPGLRARGAELAQDGVRFADLTHVFDGVEETVWSDPCCHLGDAGNRLLATAVARQIEGALAGGAFAPLDLEGVSALIAPDGPLSFDAPFASAPLRIVGFGTAGAPDLTYACDAFVSSDPGVAQVTRWGLVTAISPGACRIEARLGDMAIAVPVEVAFPPVVVLPQRVPTRGDPALHVVEHDADGVTVRVEGAPEGLQGWIAVGTSPYRAAFGRGELFVDVLAAQRVPIAGETTRVPLPGVGGRTCYLQGFWIDPRKTSGGTLSNGVAVTPGR